ncbi:DUF4446 family protein [Patescibacteria group bacterium]|nr:MAG: DUF4446 family protein [Patescibacteria group bacterium]
MLPQLPGWLQGLISQLILGSSKECGEMNTVWLVLILIALVLSAVSLWLAIRLQRRFHSSLAGSDGDSLEQSLSTYHKQVEAVAGHLDKLDDAYERLAATGSLASQKISIVRFNPFGDTGGDQSFVLAVLDAHDSGYVLTSIHGREGTRVYVKPVDYNKSKYPLSDEEKQALKQASRRVPK